MWGSAKHQLFSLPTTLNTTTFTAVQCTLIVEGNFNLQFYTLGTASTTQMLLIKNLTFTRLRTLSYLPSEEIVTQDVEYRYGFNGQERDDEIAGQGNSYTAEFWQYDSRLGRRWNIDPVEAPWESSYAAFRNNPIVLNDPNGDCPDCDTDKPDAAAGDIHRPEGAQHDYLKGEDGLWTMLAGDLPEFTVFSEELLVENKDADSEIDWGMVTNGAMTFTGGAMTFTGGITASLTGLGSPLGITLGISTGIPVMGLGIGMMSMGFRGKKGSIPSGIAESLDKGFGGDGSFGQIIDLGVTGLPKTLAEGVVLGYGLYNSNFGKVMLQPIKDVSVATTENAQDNTIVVLPVIQE